MLFIDIQEKATQSVMDQAKLLGKDWAETEDFYLNFLEIFKKI